MLFIVCSSLCASAVTLVLAESTFLATFCFETCTAGTLWIEESSESSCSIAQVWFPLSVKASCLFAFTGLGGLAPWNFSNMPPCLAEDCSLSLIDAAIICEHVLERTSSFCFLARLSCLAFSLSLSIEE